MNCLEHLLFCASSCYWHHCHWHQRNLYWSSLLLGTSHYLFPNFLTCLTWDTLLAALSRWGVRFSAPVQTGPGAHPASYTTGTESFPGVKRPGQGVDHPPPSTAEVEGRVELYVCSPSGPLSLLYLYFCLYWQHYYCWHNSQGYWNSQLSPPQQVADTNGRALKYAEIQIPYMHIKKKNIHLA